MENAKKPAHCGHPSLGAFILLGTTGSVGLNSKSASGAPSVARLTEDDYQFSYNGIILMVFIPLALSAVQWKNRKRFPCSSTTVVSLLAPHREVVRLLAKNDCDSFTMS